jgi:hypothetical protein
MQDDANMLDAEMMAELDVAEMELDGLWGEWTPTTTEDAERLAEQVRALDESLKD